MSEPFIGQIQILPYNFAPRGYAYCDGQSLPINNNAALYSVLGTIYGGNGYTDFNLPDLRERSPLHYGQGPGLTNRRLGQALGTATVTLTAAQMPSHSHNIQAGEDAATAESANGYWGVTQGTRRGSAALVYGDSGTASFDTGALDAVGGGQAHENRQPYGVVPFVIALTGLYPSRS